MARYKGHEGSASAGGNVIGELESFDIEDSVEELDANIMGVGFTDAEAGQKTYSGTISVIHDPDDTGQTALVTGDAVDLLLYPEGNTTGLTEISGSFLVTGRQRETSVGSLVKASYTVRNKGAVTEAAVA